MAEQASGGDRSTRWLTLLRRLTAAAPAWAAMKGIDSALAGTGDVDSVAPLEEWEVVRTVFVRWARDHGLGPVVVCPHAPYLLHLVALDPDGPVFFELDVNRRKIFLGSTLFTPRDLAPLLEMDPRGFRRLRPGAEGLLKLVQNGTRRGGRPNWAGMRTKRVVELLRDDPEGVAGGSALFGAAAGAATTAARRAVDGGWDRRAMLAVEGWSLLRGLASPSGLVARARFRVARRRCPVLRTVFEHQRRVPADRDAWLREVARTHEVYGAAGGGALAPAAAATSPSPAAR